MTRCVDQADQAYLLLFRKKKKKGPHEARKALPQTFQNGLIRLIRLIHPHLPGGVG